MATVDETAPGPFTFAKNSAVKLKNHGCYPKPESLHRKARADDAVLVVSTQHFAAASWVGQGGSGLRASRRASRSALDAWPNCKAASSCSMPMPAQAVGFSEPLTALAAETAERVNQAAGSIGNSTPSVQSLQRCKNIQFPGTFAPGAVGEGDGRAVSAKPASRRFRT
jgi:hypothetical protein